MATSNNEMNDERLTTVEELSPEVASGGADPSLHRGADRARAVEVEVGTESVAAGLAMATPDGAGSESDEGGASHDGRRAREEAVHLEAAELYFQGKRLAHTGVESSVDRNEVEAAAVGAGVVTGAVEGRLAALHREGRRPEHREVAPRGGSETGVADRLSFGEDAEEVAFLSDDDGAVEDEAVSEDDESVEPTSYKVADVVETSSSGGAGGIGVVLGMSQKVLGCVVVEMLTSEHHDRIEHREMGHCRLVKREGVVEHRLSEYVKARVEQWLECNRSEEEAKPISRIPGGAQPLCVGDWIQLRGR